MLGFQRRLVFFLDQGTLWPKPGPLPHTSHTAATGVRSPTTCPSWSCPSGQPHQSTRGGQNGSNHRPRRSEDVDRVRPVPRSVESQATTLWATFDAWLPRAAALIADSAPALDAMNVYPVPDSDTGTNVRLTMAGIATAAADAGPGRVDALVRGAIMSAHGNSGAIVAEMMTSIARRLADQGEVPAGVQLADLLRTAATAARRAVARPVEGTIITVAESAADAAENARDDSPRAARPVAEAAQRAAREALARTPSQLAVLAAAGVPDAGGQAYVLLLDALVEVLGGVPAEPLAASVRPLGTPVSGNRQPPLEYEVMYALHGATAP